MSRSMSLESQLYEDLLFDYIKIPRPVKNSSDVLVVDVGASLIRIIDVDEKNQILTTNLWLDMKWVDAKLKWDPQKYGGITALHIPSDMIWTPDLVLYNNAAGDPDITIITDALVSYDGRVFWQPPAIYKSFCPIDVTWFPYDLQNCNMKFGAWSYTGFYVDLRQVNDNGSAVEIKENGMDLSFFYKSAEWDLLSLRSERHSVLYASCCGPEKYVDITYYFVLRRKTLFFTCNLIVPCFLISFLTTFVFLLSHHKITFSISILVTLTVFFLVLIDIMPPTSLVIPMFGRYLITTMILVALSTIVSVVTVNFRFRSGAAHIMSPWTKTVFLKLLPKLLFIKRPEKVERPVRRPSAVPHVATELFAGAANLFGPSSSLPKTKLSSKEVRDYLSKRPSMAPPSYLHCRTPSIGYSADSLEAIVPLKMMSTSFNGPIKDQNCLVTDAMPTIPKVMNGTHSLPHSINRHANRQQVQQQAKDEDYEKTRKKVNDLILAKLLQQVKLIAEHFRRNQEEMEISDDWVFVATVLDRLFLWIFGLMNVATLWIILESPSLYDDREPLNISVPTKPLGQADVYSILNNKFR
ncbi:unnamed protein product [Bursaphelenchus okinawaensis]|uniref:Uncharacterized protein n=1 Tax=Bursaphelenchus okinawaensis TaxID=465554 RepID=A0A811KGQ8_9BILA|nr:unnamed protein product [Bursaphelenchus okinawaensis]CAG9102973.1 unnamed protein product [Bursaphelenchus okinawaensis]